MSYISKSKLGGLYNKPREEAQAEYKTEVLKAYNEIKEHYKNELDSIIPGIEGEFIIEDIEGQKNFYTPLNSNKILQLEEEINSYEYFNN